jgi:hypothetical protein
MPKVRYWVERDSRIVLGIRRLSKIDSTHVTTKSLLAPYCPDLVRAGLLAPTQLAGKAVEAATYCRRSG